jgi:hypothetical protein
MSWCDGLIASRPVELLRRRAKADDRRQAKRSRENRDVRRARPGVSRDARDRVAVELHGEAGRQIVRDENRVRALWQIDRIVIGQIEQQREQTDLDVLEITHALTKHGVRGAAESLRPLEHDDLEGLLGAEVLANQLFDGADELLVFENLALHVEDRGLFSARRTFDAIANLAQALFCPIERGVQALDLAGDRVVVNDAMTDLRDLPPQEVHRADGDAGRRGNADELSIHSALSEFIAHQQCERVERLLGVGALGAKGNVGSVFGGEHHDAHDALPVHIEVVLGDRDFGVELRGQLHDLGCGPRVQAILIHDPDGSFDH